MRPLGPTAWLLTAAVCWPAAPAAADEPDPARDRAAVRALETAIEAAIARVRPAYCVVQGGSGVVISPDGWLVTNHHVVSTVPIGKRMRIMMPGATPHEPVRLWATLIGQDVLGDIALLKVESPQPLPFAPLGQTEGLQVGQQAIALGNPFSYIGMSGEPTVSLGVISALHRFQNGYSDCIQTDAPVNPGNSGGPLLDLAGNVLGINGQVRVRFGNRINTGIGLAITADQIRAFLPALKRGGPVYHGTIQGLTLDPAHRAKHGARVAAVAKGSSADFMGFQEGDVVVAVEGRAVWNANRMLGIVGTYPAETAVSFDVERGDAAAPERIQLRGWLDSREPGAPSPNSPWLGLVPADFDATDGLLVEAVRDGSPAAQAGIRAGDRILRLGETPIRAGIDLGAALDEVRPDAAIPAQVLHADGRRSTLTVQLRPRGARP